MGMRLTGKGVVLGCESKTSEKGVYFITTIGVWVLDVNFFTKQFIEPSNKEREFIFDYDNGKLNLVLGE